MRSGGPAAEGSTVEVWFDPVCPWAYLGERRLAAALERSRPVPTVVWRSFELDPDASRVADRTATQVMLDAGSDREQLAARWRRIHDLAAAAGVAIDMDAARPVNSHDAHRLVHLARTIGAEHAVVRSLFQVHHGELRSIADHAVLAEIGVRAGLSAAEVSATLAGTRFSAEVRAEQRRAAQLGVRGVPTAVVDGRVVLPLLRPVDDLAAAITAAIAAPGDALHGGPARLTPGPA